MNYIHDPVGIEGELTACFQNVSFDAQTDYETGGLFKLGDFFYLALEEDRTCYDEPLNTAYQCLVQFKIMERITIGLELYTNTIQPIWDRSVGMCTIIPWKDEYNFIEGYQVVLKDDPTQVMIKFGTHHIPGTPPRQRLYIFDYSGYAQAIQGATAQ